MSRGSKRRLTSRVQVYYFYSYGTAAWMSEFSERNGCGRDTDVRSRLAGCAFDRVAHHDRGATLARGPGSFE